MNREQWLTKVAKRLEPLFRKIDAKLPPYRVSCSWPSKGVLAGAIGQCWSPEASADNTTEMMLSMSIADPIRVAETLVHEMVHAAVGVEHGHKAAFRKVALAVGLEGKMTATHAGEDLIAHLNEISEKVGKYPHSPLDGSTEKKQKTNLLKAECSECGYLVRVTQKWVDVATPICPVCLDPMELG